ncbi:efflux RND transporter periplasmic adaptor subunit [Enhygromyxa salina]|nr:efflux RND transporter periplasmic adaptor subunit [Enhygromyxa salina]
MTARDPARSGDANGRHTARPPAAQAWRRRAFIAGCASMLGILGCGGASGAEPGGKGGGKRGGKGGGPGGRGGGGGPPEPLAIEVAKLGPATIERHYRASGTLEPLRRAELRPIRAGIINVLEVEVGDVVEDGQILARLDGRELSMQAKRDRVAAANVEAELGRLKNLEASGAVGAEEVDARRYELESAKAAARLSGAQASTMSVRAPFAGTIIGRAVDVGNLASTATVIYELADLSALELPLHLPEREAARVTVGNSVEIELIDGSTFNGEVVRRAPIVDSLTGTVEFLVRAHTFPALAVPGAFVRARVLLERREGAPSVPTAAVFELEGQRYVYLLREGKARRVAVQIGLEGTDRVEILGGVAAEDRVLVDANGITEGMPVKPAGEPDVEREPEPEAKNDEQGKRRGGWGGGGKRH